MTDLLQTATMDSIIQQRCHCSQANKHRTGCLTRFVSPPIRSFNKKKIEPYFCPAQSAVQLCARVGFSFFWSFHRRAQLEMGVCVSAGVSPADLIPN